MSGTLTPLDALLFPILAQTSALDAAMVPIHQAIGMRLARDIIAANAVPANAIALRGGLAVCALDLVGASMHSPALLTVEPRLLKLGDLMPSGCDAILHPEAISRQGSVWEVAESIEPGTHVRFAGHDLPPGSIIARTGMRITPEIVLAMELAGIKAVTVRNPAIQINGFSAPETAWLRARMAALGFLTAEIMTPHLVIRAAAKTSPRLALQPGDTAWITRANETIIIEAPDRFDGVIAAWCALALPVLAKFLNITLASRTYPLTRKVASGIGMADIAVFHLSDGRTTPLAVGNLPLAAISAAEAFCIIAPGTEGYAENADISITSFDQPFALEDDIPFQAGIGSAASILSRHAPGRPS